jgi:hypothetical protein
VVVGVGLVPALTTTYIILINSIQFIMKDKPLRNIDLNNQLGHINNNSIFAINHVEVVKFRPMMSIMIQCNLSHQAYLWSRTN